MAKVDSLLYIKRYLKTLENVEETECVHSTYYNVGDIKIRVSNHSKKQTKVTNRYDVSIVQAINDTKQYIVTIRGSLGVSIMSLTQVKEFVRNYLLIRQMNKFHIDDFMDDETKELEVKEKGVAVSPPMMEGGMMRNHSTLSVYIKDHFKWYKRNLSDKARRCLRDYIIKKVKTKEEMNKLLNKVGEIVLKKSAKIFQKDEIDILLSSLTL